MKSAFRPVIRNNSPPARRQHIAKVCYFPIGTRLNSRQSRKPALLFGSRFQSLPEQKARPPLTGAGNRPPAKQKARSSNRAGSPLFPLWKPSTCPLPEPETRALFGNSSFSLWFPRQNRKTIWRPPGQLFFLVRFADFSCARSRIPAILKPLFNPDRRRLYEKIWLNLCSRVRKRPKKSNLSKGLAHAS